MALNKLLDNYTYISWPDLSADRLAGSELFTSQKKFARNPTGVDVEQLFYIGLAAAASTLGAYCGTSDILVAVQRSGTSTRFIRVTWTNETTWQAVSEQIRGQMHNPGLLATTELRQALDLNDKQSPHLFFWNDDPSISFDTVHPISFSFDISQLQLSIRAPKNLLHSTVSSLIASQTRWLFYRAIHEPETPVVNWSAAPPELMSTYNRVSDQELKIMYPHIPVVRLATDYLSLRAKMTPNALSVQWYPELSYDEGDSESVLDIVNYRELDGWSNQLARWLVRKGLKKEDRVAVCMQRNILFHVLMMGIMRAGGCYVPIDPELPEERKSYISRDSGAKYVFTTTDLSSESLFGSYTIYIDSQQIQVSIKTEDSADVDFASPEYLAYMLYTSGTTGTPKGCLLTHHGLAQAILALSYNASKAKMPDLSQGRYLAVASIAFDVHLAETFVPLALGMPLLSAPRSQLLEDLPRYVRRLRITHLGLVPSLIEATMNIVQEEDAGEMVLRYIASGGEKISDSILDKWADHPQVLLANYYGPSEVTIGCCTTIMNRNKPRANVGRPLANVSAYVVDEDMNILPRGGIGELVVEGPLVGRGYHDQPDLTQKVFKEWPLLGDRAYRTGDLVRMMPNSTIEILGRIDTQIKLRGVRIESEGISAIVRKAMPSTPTFVLDATTVLAKHPVIGVQQLVTFITCDPSVSAITRKSKKPSLAPPPQECLTKIRKICDIELASYMRPSHIIPLTWLPLSPNGKSDEKALISLFANLELKYLTSLIIDTNTEPNERDLSRVESEVYEVLKQHTPFKIPEPHPRLTLFECGLDSMGIIQFATALREQFGRRIGASDMMKTPTLEGISALIGNEDSNASQKLDNLHKFAELVSVDVEKIYSNDLVQAVYPPFTVQEGVLSRSAADDTLYVQHIILRCNSDTSLTQLHQAWECVMAQEDILRTVFHFGKQLVQVVLRPERCKLSWRENNISTDSESAFVQWFHAAEANPLTQTINQNCHSQPPFSVSVYSTPTDKYVVFSIHHALYDGISLPLILDTVERAYMDSPLRKTASMQDTLAHIYSVDLTKAQSFWTQIFDNCEWPAPRYTPGTEPTGKTLVVPFSTKLSSLKTAATTQQVTLQALLSTAFATLIKSHIYNKDDIVFGVIRSGRLLPLDNINEALCPLISIVPMRVNFSTKDILLDVQNTISATVEHEQISLGKVQSWVRPGQSLFDTLFSVSVNQGDRSKIWTHLETKPPKPDYLLAVEIVLSPGNDQLHLQAAWLTGVIDSEVLVEALQNFESLVADIVAGNIAGQSVEEGFKSALGSHPVPQISTSTLPGTGLPLAPIPDELRYIISDFLGVGKETLTSDITFITLGLDSIKSVGLAKILQSKGYKVSPIDLMKHATLTHLWSLLASNSHSGNNNDKEMLSLYESSMAQFRGSFDALTFKLSPGDIVEVYPVTPLQAGMLSQTVGSQGQLYTHAFPLILSSSLDFGRLRYAWSEAISRLSILRTSFHFDDDSGRWAQAIHTKSELNWSEVSYSSVEDYTLRSNDFISNFRISDENDLVNPPIRLRLFCPSTPSSGPPRLVLLMHHALYDGFSVGLLLHLVHLIFKGLPLLHTTQFTDLLPHFVYQEQKGTAFWVKNLINAQQLSLPRNDEGSNMISSKTACKKIDLDQSKLNTLLRENGLTLQCLAQAAWAKLIALLTGSGDVVFGHVVSGRSIPNASDVIGPVLNTIPCRVVLSKTTRNIDILRTIQRNNLEALSWQQASLRAIQRGLQKDTLWDNLFSFQPLVDKYFETDLWSFDYQAKAGSHQVQYLLNVEFHETQAGLVIHCAARADFSRSSSLDSLLQQLEDIINAVLLHSNDLAMEDSFSHSNIRKSIKPTQTLNTSPSVANVKVKENADAREVVSLISSISSIPTDAINEQTILKTLGIDSIMAIQLSNKCRCAGIRLSTTDIITSWTIADLIGKAKGHASKKSIIPQQLNLLPLPPAEISAITSRFKKSTPIERILPVSPGQKFSIAAWQRTERNNFHHVFVFHLPENLDKMRLKKAWILLLHRHPLLRSTFASSPGLDDPRIVVFKPEIAEDTWSEEFVEDVLFFRSALSRAKQLSEDPIPSRYSQARAILHHSSHKSLLLLHLHHFQYDAWSLPLLAMEINGIYESQSITPCDDLLTFLNYTTLTQDRLKSQDRYWTTAFPPHYQPSLFPSLHSRPVGRLQRTIYFSSSGLVKNVELCERRAAEMQTSLQTVLIAAWSQLQSSYTRSTDACFGLWHNGRTASLDHVAEMAVPCFNILPMYLDDAKGDIFSTAKKIQNILNNRTGIIEQTDFSRVNKLLGIHRPLTNVFLNVFKLDIAPKSQGGLLEPVKLPFELPSIDKVESRPVVDHLPITDYLRNDLSIDIVVLPERDEICMCVEAAASTIDLEQAQELTKEFAQIIKQNFRFM